MYILEMSEMCNMKVGGRVNFEGSKMDKQVLFCDGI